MTLLELVNLAPLMQLTTGKSEITVGLIDGPVAVSHPALTSENIREVSGVTRGFCATASSIACTHGTFVAGILSARRGAEAPAICPGCTLLVRPIFSEALTDMDHMPGATPEELATAIIETVDAGAHIINLSAGLVQPYSKCERQFQESLDYAAQRGAIVVAAAGNQGMIGSSCITGHPWVIPVIASDLEGRPLAFSNLGNSIGIRGLSAPGDRITSLGTGSDPPRFSGTSAAAPFVTGAIALLWSEFPGAGALDMKMAVSPARRRKTIVPPLLDAWAAYQMMATNSAKR